MEKGCLVRVLPIYKVVYCHASLGRTQCHDTPPCCISEGFAMDAFGQQPEIAAVLENLLKAIADPTIFLQPSQQLSHAARQAVKVCTVYRGHLDQ